MAVLNSPAIAADYLWKGNWGDWDDANQWTLLGVPGAGDSAELAGGGSWISAARSVGSLALTGGQLWGDGALTTGSLNFQRGALGGGGQASTYPTGFTTVTGTTLFNGANSQAVADNHTLTLQGDSSWTAGTGAIAGTPYGGIIVNNGTWTDFGTGSTAPGSYKSLRSDPAGGGGSFVNNGTYVRTGLGTTRAYGFDNNGTLNIQDGTLQLRGGGTSSGQIMVAAGRELAFYESAATVSGQIANLGLVSFDRSYVALTSTAALNGQIKVLGGTVDNQSSNTLTTLEMAGGQITGTGHLTTGSLNFQRGALGGGGQASTYPTGFTTVTGTTVFNGANSQAIADNHTLTLQGDSSWTAGTGAIAGTPYGGTIVNNATWTDFGTGSTAVGSYKSLRSDPVGGGGSFVNNGTYVRTGLGTTRAYGFSNAGLLQLSAGRLAVDGNFSNAGEVRIDAGAVLASVSNTFQNDGLISGTGTIRTNSLSQSFVNAGTLTPGGLGSTGSLLLDGDLAMAANGALRIDLAGGQHDLLTITSDASFAGDLQLWAAPGTALQVGDSFVVATYGQRLAGSTFGSVQWLGAGANPFSVEYGAQALTLHVTSAVPVPEPGTGLLWLGGILALAGVAARRRHQTSRLHS